MFPLFPAFKLPQCSPRRLLNAPVRYQTVLQKYPSNLRADIRVGAVLLFTLEILVPPVSPSLMTSISGRFRLVIYLQKRRVNK